MRLREYKTLREAIEEQGFGNEIEWAQNVTRPDTPIALFWEYGWVVVNSGMKNQVAAGIWQRITAALAEGAAISTAFRHPGKVAALEDFWEHRERRYDEMGEAFKEDRALDWIASLPWIGPITRWHLAKNLGVECAKPDRWLERVAAKSGETVDDLCRRLAKESGDRVATVDLVIWRACNLGLWADLAPSEPQMTLAAA